MKAWMVRVKDEFGAEVVFAETRGKARSLALRTDCCEDACFTDIEVSRMKRADKYYKDGKWHLDWDNPKDRIVLVNECGFRCEFIEPYYCEECSAREYCEDYEHHLEEESEAE